MTTTSLPAHEGIPPRYRDLVEQLSRERPAADALASTIRRALDAQPLSPESIECLRQYAADQTWHAPGQARLAAAIAYEAARTPDDDARLAECELTLGSALNALGDFASALPLLHSSRDRYLALHRPDRAAGCECEWVALYAETGELDQAEAALARARSHVDDASDCLLRACVDRAEGRLRFEQNRHVEASLALQRAADAFAALQHQGEAAVTWCLLAEALCYTQPQAAQQWIEKARAISIAGDDTAFRARCDFVAGWVCDASNRFADSPAYYRRARAAYERAGMDYHVALCDLVQGIADYRLNRFDAALRACAQARDAFAARSLDSHVSRCDLNTANIYYDLNQYDTALALYQQVVDSPASRQRRVRTSIAYANMGLCHDRLGRLDRALLCHERAYQTALDAGQPLVAARNQINLAGIYRRLGRTDEALHQFRQAQGTFAQHDLPVDTAWCETYQAELHQAREEYPQAEACLARARAAFERAGTPVQVAACGREMARAIAHLARPAEAHRLLIEARAVFARRELLVDAALCDLARAEVFLRQQQMKEAAPLLKAAKATLDPGFPDEAWRVEVGLGQCALARGKRHRALQHGLSAVKFTNQTRAALPTERMSGRFYTDRRRLYEDTLQLALELGQIEQALSVTEAAKAQTFIHWTGHRGRRDRARGDAYLVKLEADADQLQREIAALRDQLRAIQSEPGGWQLRGEETVQQVQQVVLDQLAQRSHAYEGLIDQLRIAAPGQPGVYPPRVFAVQQFREVAIQHLPERWLCVAYYLLDDQLLIFSLDAQHLVYEAKPLRNYDRQLLEQCTSSDREVREMIYGSAASALAYLRHLYQLLVPREVEALGETDLLILAPHGRLHLLPFHALQRGDGAPLDRIPTLNVPSLSALESLLHTANGRQSIERVLAVGLSDFGDRIRRLPHARAEIDALGRILNPRLDERWGSEATRSALADLDQTGRLARYDVIHFATHAMLDELAPSRSAILLHDGDLTFADILDLTLEAQLVVLASCEGALGRHFGGDEIMGLAQAFFHAGARTVVASLWPVEDGSTRDFMERFYRHLDAGRGASRALRLARREMAEAGHAPYNWAAFVAIGCP
jgi:CHAT domain-containing protein